MAFQSAWEDGTMGSGERIGDGGIEDPGIRTGDVGNPDIRTGDVGSPDIRTGDVGNPDIRDGSIDNPDLSPQPMSGGIPVVPIAIIGGVVVVAIAAFSLLGGGGPSATTGPGSSAAAGATGGPGATGPGSAPTGGAVGPGASSGSGEAVATLTIRGGFEDSFTELEGDNVSPTSDLVAAVWAEARDNLAESYADIATVSLAGPVFSGERATSEGGVVLSFNVSRTDAGGNDLYFHQWTSTAGECTVTMQPGSAISGEFRCSGLTSDDGLTVEAEGTYRT